MSYLNDKVLNENDVVQAVVEHFKKNSYEIIQVLTTKDHGHDIVAKDLNGCVIYIEAKGGTSSKEGTSRYEKGFDRNQKRTHVAVAILKAMQTKQQENNPRVGIAVPDDKDHKDIIASIHSSLNALGIEIYYVDGMMNVNKV